MALCVHFKANFTRSRNFRRGYYAAVSYTDYNIGVLLKSLDDFGFTDNTAVILFGDHGWQVSIICENFTISFVVS